MSDVDRLLAAFDSGELVRPSAERPNLLDLVSALSVATGAATEPATAHAGEILQRLDGAEHIVLLLADGLGLHFFETLRADGWLRAHLVRALQAPFPPTTAVSLTSLASGLWLTDHATPGWWTYLPGRDLVIVPVPYQRLVDEHPLDELGVPPEEVFPAPALTSRMRMATELVMPRAIADSVYSRYMGGGAPRYGYDSLRQAAEHIVARIESATSPTYTYWYFSRVDTLAHELGTDDDETLGAARELDQALAAFSERLAGMGGRARVIVTADHGHRDVPDGARSLIEPHDVILDFLRCQPTGDVRAVYFHLREGITERVDTAFRAAFAHRFGERWLLISTDEVEALRLMGPGLLSAETRRRVGDYTAVPLGAEVMRFGGVPGSERFMQQRSQHSGLSHDEMTVPLVIG